MATTVNDLYRKYNESQGVNQQPVDRPQNNIDYLASLMPVGNSQPLSPPATQQTSGSFGNADYLASLMPANVQGLGSSTSQPSPGSFGGGSGWTDINLWNTLNSSGQLSQWSQEDLNRAMTDSSFGWGIFNYKNDWADARARGDTQGELNANAGANYLRGTWGGYSGGTDGSGGIPESYWDSMVRNILGQIDNYGQFSYDPYQSQYATTQQQLLDNILNRGAFNYVKEEDPQWASYRQSYLREGDRATQNALARASQASGGRPSSYAATAASQAGDYYASRLNDIIPQLYQQAYNRYVQEYQMMHQDLGMVNTMDNTAYGRWSGERDFGYQDYLNQYNMLNNQLGNYQNQSGIAYNRMQDDLNRRTDEFRYGNAQQQQQWANAMDIWGQLGYTTEQMESILGLPPGTLSANYALDSNQQYLNYAQRGIPYTGIPTTMNDLIEAAMRAQQPAVTGGGGYYGGGGGGSGGNVTTTAPNPMTESEWNTARRIYNTSGIGPAEAVNYNNYGDYLSDFNRWLASR